MDRIYLDYNASTPLCEAARKILTCLQIHETSACNASSMHHEGRKARSWIDEARWRVAKCLSVEEGEIVFTSGGTESNHLGIIGGFLGRQRNLREASGGAILTSAIEHHCVLAAADWLQRWMRIQAIQIGVDEQGLVQVEDLKRRALSLPVALVSIMAANNEVGTRQPVEEIGEWCRQHDILFHVDAVQLAGKCSLKKICENADFVSISGHKIYGPHGIGVLYVRSGRSIEPIFGGGWQEMGRRAGTEFAAGALALASALEDCQSNMVEEGEQQWQLIEKLWKGIAEMGEVRRNGDPIRRVPNTLSVTFSGIDQQALLIALDLEGLSVSSGSACVVGTWQPSHVLKAMGADCGGATVRFSVGRQSTVEEVDEAIRRVKAVVSRLRSVQTMFR
jgi:cysteine desulfurase